MLKQVFYNTLSQLVAKFFGVALTFLTTIYIIRLGSPALYGDLLKILSLTAIGVTAIDFGINASAVRQMSESPKEKKRIAWNTLTARLVLSALAVITLNILVWFLPGGYTPAVKIVFWLGSLSIIFQGIFTSINAYFQSELVYWKMSVSSVTGSVVGAILTFYYLSTGATLGNLLLSSSLGYLVMAVISLVLSGLWREWKLGTVTNFFSLLKDSAPIGGILVLSVLASKIDSILLGIFRSSTEIGHYGLAYRVFDVALVLPVFVMNALYPVLLSNHKNRRRLALQSSLSLFAFGTLAALLLYLFAPLLSLIKADLQPSIAYLQTLALSLPIFYLTAPLLWELITARREKPILLLYAFAALFNSLGNYLLIPSYGATSSAYLTWATEAIILLGLLKLRQQLYDKS